MTAAALRELDEDQTAVQIERESTRGLQSVPRFLRGAVAFALLLGAGGLALGGAFARHLIGWVLFGGRAHTAEAYAVGPVPLGLWLVYVAVRRRYFVRVDTDKGHRKLAFTSAATRDEILAFARAAERSLGLPVKVELQSLQ